MRDYETNDPMTRDRYARDYDRDRREDRGFFRSNDENRESGWLGSRDEERDYGPDQTRRGIPRDETSSLIASDKVEGTPVYGRDREQLGTIHNFMVEKRSGRARYAVMKTNSGFLGLNERYFPLEWNELTYDTRVDGYHIDMTEDDLERRRSFDSRGRPSGIDSRRRDYGDRSYRRYGRDYERSSW